ncbi:unnamed protein product [Cylindrotheca closterium]|uniref:Uncharacterized protein n=1 Tax=Cylindrotheca closterium TaxID=2856 RepID=A0AAD2CP67_9STRA|nr:unnamed protein product [Cylindrotheca closterium]
MKFSAITLAVFAVSGFQNGLFGPTCAFQQHASIVSKPRPKKSMATRESDLAAHSHHSQEGAPVCFINNEEPLIPLSNIGKNNDFGRHLRQMGAGVVAATAVSFAAVTSDSSQLSSTVANAAELNLSKGAIVIQLTAPTTTKESDGESTQSTAKGQFKKFDASQEQKLLQTLLKNRKELGASIGRIQQSIQNELQLKDSTTAGPTAAPIWTEIYQELLSIEGDVVPKVQITPPVDLAATVRDLRNGQLNLLVDGEIINVSVEPTFGKDEDDLIIRIKGFKGGMIPKATKEAPPPTAYYGPIRSWLSRFDGFWSFWDSPTALFGTDGPGFLSEISNGEVVISGATSAIVLSYVVAYSYYLQQIEEEAAEAAAKQAAIAEKAKQKKAKVVKAAAVKETASTKESKQTKADVLKSLGKDQASEEEESSPPPPTSKPKKSTRRHRFRFWKNRQTESQ